MYDVMTNGDGDEWYCHLQDELRIEQMATATYTEGKEVRVIFKCRCKHAWAHFYITTIKGRLVYFYREVGGEMIESYKDATCTKCGTRRGVTSSVVQGTLKPEVKCDAKCTSARGSTCNCSCGGKRHGEDWMVE